MNLNKLENRIDELSNGYFPGSEIASQLNQVEAVAFIGASATGKTTTIEALLKNFWEFNYAHGFTTRDRREGEDPNFMKFIPHNRNNLASILRLAEEGQLVQVAVHPETRKIYGSSAEDYKPQFTVIDAMSKAIDQLRTLPFKNMLEFTTVCQPNVYDQRFAGRIKDDPAQAMARRVEAISSLEWSLDQGDDMVWLDTTRKVPFIVAGEVAAVARGYQVPRVADRQIGETLLQHIKAQ